MHSICIYAYHSSILPLYYSAKPLFTCALCALSHVLCQIKDLYVDLRKCREGETVGMFCSQDPSSGEDTWYLVINGRNIHRLAVKVPHERYAVVDVYGQCVEVELLPLRDAAPLRDTAPLRDVAPLRDTAPLTEKTQVKAGGFCTRSKVACIHSYH